MIKNFDAQFCEKIKQIVDNDGLTHLEALIEYAKEKNIDLEYLPELLDRELKNAVENEADILHLLKPKKAKK